MMSICRRRVAAFTCAVSVALIAPPCAIAAEDLERVFIGEPTQLTLPPDPGDGPVIPHSDAGSPRGLECDGPSQQDATKQLDGACSPGASVSRSRADDDESLPEAKSPDLGSTLAKTGTDAGKPVP